MFEKFETGAGGGTDLSGSDLIKPQKHLKRSTVSEVKPKTWAECVDFNNVQLKVVSSLEF
jgi:hypothetical protein